MKKHSLFLVMLFVFAVSGSAQNATVEEDVAAIKKLYEQVVAAVNANDAGALVALFTDDAMLLPPNRTVIVGKEAVGDFFRRILDRNTVEVGSANLEEVFVSGGWAFARDTAVDIFTPKGGGEARQNNIKHVYLLQRQSDGSWRLARMMWNSNVRRRAGATE